MKKWWKLADVQPQKANDQKRIPGSLRVTIKNPEIEWIDTVVLTMPIDSLGVASSVAARSCRLEVCTSLRTRPVVLCVFWRESEKPALVGA